MKITKVKQPQEVKPKVPAFKVGDVLELNVKTGEKLTYLVTDLSGLYYLTNVNGRGKWTDPKESLKEFQVYLDASSIIKEVKVYSASKVELILEETE